MLSPLRNRFGIPGVISVVALVFAMLGGAYAANNASDNGATASAKKKAKKGPRGPKGATGPAGPAGAAGPAGPAGAKGDKGDAGANGTNGTSGTNGTNGQSVTTEAEPPFGNCGEQEGVKLTSASGTSYVCNGVNGANGQTGFTDTLPPGKTEKGVWTADARMDQTFYELGYFFAPVSFGIPLAAPLAEAEVHVEGEAGFGSTCTGSVANPTAPSGELCVYTILENSVYVGPEGLSTGGVILMFEISGEKPTENKAPVVIFGSWAVTG